MAMRSAGVFTAASSSSTLTVGQVTDSGGYHRAMSPAPAPGPTPQPRPRRTGAKRRPRRWMRQVNEFSAGGLVVDLAGEVPRGALIGRTDRHGRLLWSLPKGHIEAGETAEQAAVREVEEETGISGEILAQ